MREHGFISGKLEIKFLILYVASRVEGAVPFEVLQELSMCDAGVDYFGFSECLEDLVRTEHMAVKGGLYAITDKGRNNSDICESSLPYAVRLQADRKLVDCNQQLRRSALIGAEVKARERGGWTVQLSLKDDLDEVMRLELLVTREDMAQELQQRFRERAEDMYTGILNVLFDDSGSGE